MLAALAGLVGRAASAVTGVDVTPPPHVLAAKDHVPDWHGGYAGAHIPRGFMRINGTHGSTRTRRFRSLKNKSRARRYEL